MACLVKRDKIIKYQTIDPPDQLVQTQRFADLPTTQSPTRQTCHTHIKTGTSRRVSRTDKSGVRAPSHANAADGRNDIDRDKLLFGSLVLCDEKDYDSINMDDVDGCDDGGVDINCDVIVIIDFKQI